MPYWHIDEKTRPPDDGVDIQKPLLQLNLVWKEGPNCRVNFADFSLLFRSFSRTTNPFGSNQWSKALLQTKCFIARAKPCLWICESPTLQTEPLAPHPSIISNFADFHCQFCRASHLNTWKHDLFQKKKKKKT